MRLIEAMLSRSAHYGHVSDVLFRVLFSLIFIVGGLGHFFRTAEMLARIEESPWAGAVHRIGDPTILLWLSGAVLVLGGICLALGKMTRLSALLLFVTLIPITISVHVAPGHVGPLLKNVAILGGLIHFFVRGPGSFCSAAGCKAASRGGGRLSLIMLAPDVGRPASADAMAHLE